MMERTTSEIHVLLHVSSLNLSLSLLRLCLTKPRPVRQYSTHCQSYLLRNSQTFCPNLPTSFRTNQERPPWVCTILSFCRILSQSVPEKCEYLRKKLDDLLWQGIIEESESPWASPIVMVPKSDGTYGSALTSARSTLSLYPIRSCCHEWKIYSIVSEKPDTSRSLT